MGTNKKLVFMDEMDNLIDYECKNYIKQYLNMLDNSDICVSDRKLLRVSFLNSINGFKRFVKKQTRRLI